MRKVLVNINFKDKYNPKKVYEAGKTYNMSEERIKEIKEVNPNFIEVLSEERKKVAPAQLEETAAEETVEEIIEE